MKVYYASDSELKQLVHDPSVYSDPFAEQTDEGLTGEQPAAPPISQPQPVYRSYSYVRKGERVYVDVRQSEPVTIDGFSI